MLKRVFVLAGTFGTMMALAAVGCSSSSTDLTGGGNGNGDSGSEGDGTTGFGKDSGSKTDGGPTETDSGTIGKKDGGGIISTVDAGTVTNPVDAGTIATLDAGHLPDGGSKDAGVVTLADGGTIACFSSDTANYDNSTGPVANQGKCTASQITTFDTDCFGSGASTAACNALITADGPCATCIFGGASSPSAVVLPIGAQDEVNSSACYAAISATATAQCKYNYENVTYCSQTACGTCADDATFSTCDTYAQVDPGSVCAANFGLDTTCVDDVEGSLTVLDATNKCGYNATSFDTAFVAVATTFCGP